MKDEQEKLSFPMEPARLGAYMDRQTTSVHASIERLDNGWLLTVHGKGRFIARDMRELCDLFYKEVGGK